MHVTAYGEPMVATGITDGHTPHVPGALLEHAALGAAGAAACRSSRWAGSPPRRPRQALGRGDADVIAMGRAAHRRPRPARQARQRASATASGPCAYQYKCIGAIFLNDAVRCAVNPDAGHEHEADAWLAPARRRGPSSWSVAVRPGSSAPAVSPSAATGSSCGSAAARLGGRLALAEVADPDLLGLRDWLVGAAEDAGVVVRLGQTADAASLAAAGADVVVWAAGATWAARPGPAGPRRRPRLALRRRRPVRSRRS